MEFEEVTIGPCRLIRGDCRELLSPIDGMAIVTDPPFGISHESRGQRFVRATRIDGDDGVDVATWVFDFAERRDVPLVMFYSPYKPIGDWRSVLCWNKGAHVGIGGDRETCWKRDMELIGVRGNGVLLGKRDSCVLPFNAVSPPPSGHFCEKPLPLMRYLVGKLSNQTIVDPCMGSGTTGEASILEDRSFIGIETDAKWFDYSCRRIERAWLDKKSELPFEKPPIEVQRPLFEEMT